MINIPACVVCLQELRLNIVCTPCGHVFHSECMRNCLKNKLSCPLCREKVNLNGLVEVMFEITGGENNKKEGNTGVGALEEKIRVIEGKLESKDWEIERLFGENARLAGKLATLQKKFSVCEGKLIFSEGQREKFEDLYQSTSALYSESLISLNKLENISSLVRSLETSQSIVPWISNTKALFSLPEQIEHFHSSLLITSNSLKSTDSLYKQLKQEHLKCEEKFSALQKALNSCRQSQNIIENLPIKVM